MKGIAKPAKRRISKAEAIVPAWNRPWLIAGFSTRGGGVSTVFGGHDLNLGFVKHDTRAAVETNRKRFMDAVAGKKRNGPQLVTLKQIHSDAIHVITAGSKGQLTGDGMVTNVPGVLLGIQVADCVPVLLFDTKKKVVGAFHAGWRGTAKRIVEKGVGRLRVEFGSNPADIRAAIGPCIMQCCYAVGDEVIEQFESQFAYAKELFREVYDDDPIKKKYPLLFLTARAPGHSNLGPQIHLDLVEANRRQLLDAGVPAKNIWAAELCTSCNPDWLFSHRKDGGFTGRMMGVVGIR